MLIWNLRYLSIKVLTAEAPGRDRDTLIIWYTGKLSDLCYSLSTVHITMSNTDLASVSTPHLPLGNVTLLVKQAKSRHNVRD